MRYYSYDEFKKDILTLSKTLKHNNYDTIITIARGGFIPTHAIGEALGIRHIQTLNAISYDKNIKQHSVKLETKELNLARSKKVLVVDDISDSGETLDALMGYLEKNFRDLSFESATLFYKKTSIYKPTYYVQEANEWIEFFWERDFRLMDEELLA